MSREVGKRNDLVEVKCEIGLVKIEKKKKN